MRHSYYFCGQGDNYHDIWDLASYQGRYTHCHLNPLNQLDSCRRDWPLTVHVGTGGPVARGRASVQNQRVKRHGPATVYRRRNTMTNTTSSSKDSKGISVTFSAHTP